MIFFYNKNTKKIVGTVEGRVHHQHILDNVFIRPSGVDPKDIGKFVVPFVKSDKKDELVPNVPFAQDILDFESGGKKMKDHRVKLNKNGELVGFEMV